MTPSIRTLADAALDGDWAPLTNAASGAPRRWAESAACASDRPDDWMPRFDSPTADPENVRLLLGGTLAAPLSACAGCPVAARCLMDSVALGDAYGIRGGLLAAERSALTRSWHTTVRADRVEDAVAGAACVPLTAGERQAAVQAATDATVHDLSAAAQGIGVSREYLVRRARNARYRKPENRLSA
ncbi:WhiB family transcriptional regulator [Streptomyces sp. BI20]|uniref:WhiB family transcriptional regulator n=1 Tax=Streptomyces sp. BI20 TaxID=3403460 RepID=UPI003C74DEEB